MFTTAENKSVPFVIQQAKLEVSFDQVIVSGFGGMLTSCRHTELQSLETLNTVVT